MMTSPLNDIQVQYWTLINLVITGIIAAIWTASWAIILYRKSNRIKAAEIYFSIEKSFSKHIPFLLEIENSATYLKIEKALQKADNYTKKDIKIYQKLDSMLCHFATCYQIKKLHVDHNTMITYGYYLDVFCKSDRYEIRAYIQKYFVTVDEWIRIYEEERSK
jgi:hypothetical protein